MLAKKLAKSRVEKLSMPPTQADILAERDKMEKRRQQLCMGFEPFNSDDSCGGFY